MTRTVHFTKMVASGNDFVVVDTRGHRSRVIGHRLITFAKKICDRKYGIGADGLLFLEKSKKTNFKMRIFNPDGSEPAMCGNGARCAALFAKSIVHGPQSIAIKFETKAGIIEAQVKKDTVRLKMTEPKDLWKNIDLNLGTNFIKVHYIDTGVPHAVFFVGNVDTVNVKEIGRGIRFHKQFQPEGANADFAQLLNKNSIKLRTYERGVEDETLACGTGSVAAALISRYANIIEKSPILVHTRGGEILRIYFEYKNKKFSNVWLEGLARVICEGHYHLM